MNILKPISISAQRSRALELRAALPLCLALGFASACGGNDTVDPSLLDAQSAVDEVDTLKQALSADEQCATVAANSSFTGFVTGSDQKKVVTNATYNIANCTNSYRVDIANFAGGVQTVGWGDTRISTGLSQTDCLKRKVRVYVWDKTTATPTYVGSRTKTATYVNSSQCLNAEIPLNGWLTKGRTYRIAVRAETETATGYSRAAIGFRSNAVTKCSGDNNTNCWHDQQAPAYGPVGVAKGIACWGAPNVDWFTLECFEPRGTSGKASISVVGSGDRATSGSEPNWSQIPFEKIRSLTFVPFTPPADWIIPAGSNTSGDYWLYILMNDGSVFRSPPGQPPNDVTPQWVYLRHRYLDVERYMPASATPCQLQYIDAPQITGLRARTCTGGLATIHWTSAFPDHRTWLTAAMPAGWPSTIDELSGSGGHLMWGRKGNTLYAAGSTEFSSGAVAAVPGGVRLADGNVVETNAPFECEVDAPGTPGGVIEGVLRGACSTDLKRFVRFEPSLIGTALGPWTPTPGPHFPWDVQPGSTIYSDAVAVHDAAQFRGRAGEIFVIHNWSRFYAYVP